MKKRKKAKKLSMRKGMKVTFYGCKRWESNGSLVSICDLQNLLSERCDIEKYRDGCNGCEGEITYTFQLIERKVMKPPTTPQGVDKE